MKIKICKENEAKINAVLNEVQRKCRARTVDMMDIVAMTSDVEKRLGIAKSALKGVSFSADDHAQAFPNAYKGIPESTIVYCTHNGTAWFLTDVKRENTRRPTVAYRVQLTEEAKEKIIDRCTCFGW